MTTQANTRRFSPIFVATVIPQTIETAVAANGNDYAKMPAATIQQRGRADKVMTVMAFGKQHAEVSDRLIAGRPVDLAVQYDGGTLKVIGLPLAKAA